MAQQQEMSGWLGFIEKWGNRLPDPFFIFVYLALIVMLLSWGISLVGTTVVHPGTGEELAIRSLISGEGIQYILGNTLSNFTGFAPLGLVLSMMLGIGLADKVGLMEAVIKKSILNAPRSLITYAVIFIGIMGNIASDAAFVLVPPLAAMVFYTVGRHPLAGLAAGFAGTGAGFTANILIAGTDALLSGISTEAARAIDDTIVVTPVANWYFMSLSVFVLAFLGAQITERLIEPKLGSYKGELKNSFEPVSAIENRGLRNAGIAALVFSGLVVLILFWPGSALRNEDGGIIPSPFLSGIVPVILLFFIIVGVAYGKTVGTIEKSKDIPAFMGLAMKDMSAYIVLIFAAAQFINYFNWSNLGIWVAVNSAEFLININMTGLPVIIGFTLLAALLNLLIFSGSAQWALMAPIFVPMFMLLDYDPAFIQLAYRIADSSTNIITPLNPYILIVLAFMREYNKEAGIGTLISLMLPYTLIFLSAWIGLLVLFAVLGLPIGPGAGIYL
ncbi:MULTISPECIES: AbgT family transporter [Halomonadaceae]|uniref:AbgT family transporter n=1 Tax=Halomonadaceae TaxID=28256 RepID=UPI0015973932|nr:MULTISPECIES: AbgT family transporter [Halomonas]QJQ96313.1 AbgT family transporter [Halomonas sp. PA5]